MHSIFHGSMEAPQKERKKSGFGRLCFTGNFSFMHYIYLEKNYDNENPRKWLAVQTGFRERANSAQQNSWESFIWFSASLTLALIFSPDNIDFVNLMSVLYIFLRVFYVLFYIFGFSNLRTISWLCAHGCVFGILFSALN